MLAPPNLSSKHMAEWYWQCGVETQNSTQPQLQTYETLIQLLLDPVIDPQLCGDVHPSVGHQAPPEQDRHHAQQPQQCQQGHNSMEKHILSVQNSLIFTFAYISCDS